jgi:minor extracellular serine protease Vpr
VLTRTPRLAVAAVGLALALSLARPLAGRVSTVTGDALVLPPDRELVQDVIGPGWGTAPSAALVQLDEAPLAAAGRSWDHERRRAYLAELDAAQDEVAAAVEARGGTVLARFSHAANGLAVAVTPAVAAAIGELDGVSAVLRVGDYAADQTAPGPAASLAELSALISADEVRRLGSDGRGVDIAVVDSGVDYTHLKLGGPGDAAAYNRAVCGSPGLAPGDPGCAQGLAAPPADLFPNAKVRGGYDYVGDIWPNPDPRCGVLGVCDIPDPNPIDLAGHGTHVADIAAGLPTTAGGADAGVAPGANVWAFKACNGEAALCSGVALLKAVDAAMDLDGSDQGLCTPGVTPGCLAYDPADVINLSLSYAYGQPEDTLTLFVNLAGYYGSLVVASAGNDGDRPYIVGSPGTAAAALAVAESTFPNAPAAELTVAGRQLDARHQPWSPPAAAGAAPLSVGDGCAPLAPLAGALLVEGGRCAAQAQAANAAAAGATLLLVADSGRADIPPALTGTASPIPVYSLPYAEGQRLRAAAAAGAVAVTAAPAAAVERVAPDASRGPRINDSWLKPDLAAPGAVASALAGSGAGLAPFGGSSGAAPVASGVAALLVQRLEDFGAIDPSPGLGVGENPRLSLAPVVKALLMNSAADVGAQGGGLAPLTLQGAGRVSALDAFSSRTIAWDASAMISLLARQPQLTSCTVRPYGDLLAYLFFGRTPPCADKYPFGDELFQAWNAQTGSVSFGYRPAVGLQELSRQVVVYNYSRSPRSYTLGTSLRFADDVGRGVSLSVTPAALTLPPAGSEIVTLTMTISPGALRDWTLNGGRLGASGSASCDSPAPEVDCPSLGLFEADGALLIDGGARNRVSVPVYVLPRKAADVVVSRVDESQILLSNLSPLKAGLVEPFALVESSPNKCDLESTPGVCLDSDYSPGARPGLGRSPVDIDMVGVRGYAVPGLNAALGLPDAPAGALADEVVEFAVTVFDRPYRASPNFPVQFEVHVDANRDTVTDYVVFNDDLARGQDGFDGRSAVFVRDANPADGTRPTRAYLFAMADFNTQNWALPVPAAAVDLRSDQQFRWHVRAYDAYFRAPGAATPWDCSPAPAPGAACGAAAHATQTGALRFRPAALDVSVAPASRATLAFDEDPGGAAASPSQIGLMLLFRDAMPGRESARVLLR